MLGKPPAKFHNTKWTPNIIQNHYCIRRNDRKFGLKIPGNKKKTKTRVFSAWSRPEGPAPNELKWMTLRTYSAVSGSAWRRFHHIMKAICHSIYDDWNGQSRKKVWKAPLWQLLAASVPLLDCHLLGWRALPQRMLPDSISTMPQPLVSGIISTSHGMDRKGGHFYGPWLLHDIAES